jgi:hypothetical protein
MLSASKLWLAAKCAGSQALPQASTFSQAADDGVARHQFFETAPIVGVEAAIAAAPEHLRDLLRMLAEHPVIVELLAEKSMAEVPLAWDWLDGTARVLPSHGHRDYSDCLPTELPGTADRVTLPDADTVVVVDIKGREHQEAAAEHHQLRFLGLAAASAYGRTHAIVAWVKTMDGVPQVDYASFDAFDLAGIAEEVRRIADRVEAARAAVASGERPALARGPWCRRCDAFDACPAQHELLQIAVRKPEQLANEAEIALANGGRARAYEIWRELELLTKRIGERVGAHAAMRAIELPGGRAYGFAPGRREVEDATKARDILLAAGVPAAAVAAAVMSRAELHTTLAAVDKALKALPKPEREPVMQKLRAAGAVRQGVALKEHEIDVPAVAGSEAA